LGLWLCLRAGVSVLAACHHHHHACGHARRLLQDRTTQEEQLKVRGSVLFCGMDILMACNQNQKLAKDRTAVEMGSDCNSNSFNWLNLIEY
jgi:hypothetical protein